MFNRYVEAKEGDFFIADWLRNKNTLEFLSIWEQINNPDFNYGEFAIITSGSGLNTFKISVKELVVKTGMMGLYAKTGRYGGTYAHRDIAFEFGSWISPTFKLYLIREYQRLKENESNQFNLEWNVKRILSKLNYVILTDAVKHHIVPLSERGKDMEWLLYAEEADLLNVALFGCTARQWKDANPDHSSKRLNMRDFASINELAVLSNLESINSEWIKSAVEKQNRFTSLCEIATHQLEILSKQNMLKSIKKLNDSTYVNSKGSKNKK